MSIVVIGTFCQEGESAPAKSAVSFTVMPEEETNGDAAEEKRRERTPAENESGDATGREVEKPIDEAETPLLRVCFSSLGS